MSPRMFTEREGERVAGKKCLKCASEGESKSQKGSSQSGKLNRVSRKASTGETCEFVSAGDK